MKLSRMERGFTLMEVMLAMTLLGIMAALLFGSLRISAESWNAGESKIEQVNEKAVVYQFFKRHLTAIRPLWDDFSGERKFSFQGERHRLQFVSLFPASAGRKGLQLFEVGIDPRERDAVSVRLTPFFPNEENRDWREERDILLEHVAVFEVEYFERAPDSGGIWLIDWTENEMLPALVKIHIELEDGSYWPDMVFPLRLAPSSEDNQTAADTPFDDREGVVEE